MAARTQPESNRQTFRRQWDSLAVKARSVRTKYHADLFLLIFRSGRWHSKVCRYVPKQTDEAAAMMRGEARRMKEGFRRQRESIVNKIYHISRQCRADVYFLATRKGRWYAGEYLRVSFHHRHEHGRSLTGVDEDEEIWALARLGQAANAQWHDGGRASRSEKGATSKMSAPRIEAGVHE